MRLETARLLLRDFTMEDIDQANQYLSDPEVMRYIEHPYDRERTEKFICECGIEYSLIFALVEKASQKVIGHVIFHPFDSAKEYELGWIIGKGYQQNGYAYEISKALISYAFTRLGLEQVVAETTRDNKASLALIHKLNMTKEKERSGETLVLYSIRKETAK